MVLRMARPTHRENSSRFQFRQRVPADVAHVARGKLVLVELPASPMEPPVTISALAGTFIKFSLRTGDPALAKIRHAAANTQVARHFSAWRTGPTTLPLRTLVALSGEVYRLYVQKFEEEPGSPDDWAAFKAFNRAAREGRLLNAPLLHPGARQLATDASTAFGPGDLSAAVNRLPTSPHGSTALERRFGMVTDWVLQKHGLSVDQDTRERLLVQVELAATDAAWALKRNASGDYTPDPKAARFPPVSVAAPTITLDALFEKWEKETKPAASTRTSWLSNLRSLKEHLGETAGDISKINAEHILAWKDAAVERGLTAKTINDSYLGSMKALFGYGLRNKLLATNPADGIRVVASACACAVAAINAIRASLTAC